MTNSKLEKIEDLLRQADRQSLLKGGRPPLDQYDGEALKLALKLNQFDTVASIQQKLWDVFYEGFCTGNVYYRGNLKFFKKTKEESVLVIGTVDSYFDLATKVKEILDE